jgi:hypothetical protein
VFEEEAYSSAQQAQPAQPPDRENTAVESPSSFTNGSRRYPSISLVQRQIQRLASCQGILAANHSIPWFPRVDVVDGKYFEIVFDEHVDLWPLTVIDLPDIVGNSDIQ